MTNLKNKILDNLEKKDLQPRSKYYFYLRESGVVFLSFVNFFFSGLVISLLYYLFINRNLLISVHLVFVSLFFVIVCFGLLFLTWKMFQKIKNMYRKTYVVTFLLALFFTISLSFFNFSSGVHVFFDTQLNKFFPVLSLEKNIKKSWSHEEKGYLAGEIIGIDSDGMVYLQSFNGKIHFLDPELLSSKQRKVLVRYLRIKAFGFLKDDIFYPLDLESWSLEGKPNYSFKKEVLPFKNDNIFFE